MNPCGPSLLLGLAAHSVAGVSQHVKKRTFHFATWLRKQKPIHLHSMKGVALY